MLFSCKCLNIQIISENENGLIENGKLKSETSEIIGNLTRQDQNQFFKEIFVHLPAVSIIVQQDDLIQAQTVKDWTINRCVNCNEITHGINLTENICLLNSALLTNDEEVNRLKTVENFSSIFNILINKNSINFDFHGKILKNDPKLYNLTQFYHETVQNEMLAVEERIRNYSEKQYDQLKIFRERAEQEYEIVAGLAKRKQILISTEINPTGKLFSLETPPLTPENSQMAIENSPPLNQPQQKLIGNWQPTLKLTGVLKNSNRNILQVQSSVPRIDSECIFDLEDMDDTYLRDNQNMSEAETDDEDDEMTKRDYSGRQYSKQASLLLAKSLPISVPIMPDRLNGDEYDESDDDNIDIAASIKALAKSVHGDTVFGDLPRPRFSTQI